MDERSFKKKLILLYIFLGLGALDIFALLMYSYLFHGELINSISYGKIGLIIILFYGVVWIVTFFVYFNSKKGRLFIRNYDKYKKKNKHNNSKA